MIRRAMRFWSEETGLTALLIFLSFEMFLLFPLLHRGVLLGLVNASLYSFLLLAGLLTITRHPVLRSASALFVVAIIAVDWLRFAGIPGLLFWDALLSALGPWRADSCDVVGGPQGRPGNRAPDTWRDSSLPSPCGFLRICLRPHRIRVPGFLRFPEGMQAAEGELHQGFLYFSVVTITTLGYGDITPIHPWARSAVMLEAIIGPLYLAILVARLVSLGIETGKPPSDDDGSDRQG